MEAVNFIDKEKVAPFQIGEDTGQISCFFNLWTAGDMEFAAEGTAKDVGQSGFSQTGRATQQHVVERVTALLGGFAHQHQAFFYLCLAAELLEVRRPQAAVEFRLGRFIGFAVEIVAHTKKILKFDGL